MRSTLPHRALARTGIAALFGAAGLAAAVAPAQAAAGGADLLVRPYSNALAGGTAEAAPKHYKLEILNAGSATAKDVRVTVDMSGLGPRLGFVKPDACQADSATVFTCTIGDIAAGTNEFVSIPLYAKATNGSAGSFTVKAASSTPDPDQENNEFKATPIVTAKDSHDLTAWAQDIHTAPGQVATLNWHIHNGGTRAASGLWYQIQLPKGVTLAQLPDGCSQSESDKGNGLATCTASDVVLAPGKTFTKQVQVKVDAKVTGPVLSGGSVFALSIGEAPEAKAQAAKNTDVESADNSQAFDVFVAQRQQDPSPSPSAPSSSPAPGNGGSLPVTGAQASVVGGVGLAVVAVGGVLFMMARRRRVVLVSPDDEKPTV